MNLFDKNFSFFILKILFMCSYMYIYVERKIPIIAITITLQNKPPSNIQPYSIFFKKKIIHSISKIVSMYPNRLKVLKL